MVDHINRPGFVATDMTLNVTKLTDNVQSPFT